MMSYVKIRLTGSSEAKGCLSVTPLLSYKDSI